MHTTTWRARLLLALGILSGVATLAQAAPVDYNITFTVTDGNVPLPAAGSFTYDADTPLFTNFHVVWNNQDFDLTSAANAPFNSGLCGGGSPSGPAAGFAILSGNTICPSDQLWAAFNTASSSYLMLFASNNNFSTDVTALNIVLDIYGLAGPSGDRVLGGGTLSIAPADVTAIPEPTSLVLLGTGLLGAAAARRRKTR